MDLRAGSRYLTKPRRRYAIIGVGLVATAASVAVIRPAITRDNVTVQDLVELLQERDNIIAQQNRLLADLARRISIIEDELAGTADWTGVPVAQEPRPPERLFGVELAAFTPDTAGSRDPGRNAASAPSGSGSNQTPPGSMAQSQGEARSALAASQELERALERSLTAEGSLLLPAGQMEITPSFAYTRREESAPALVNSNGSSFVGNADVERDEFMAALGLKVGLPFDSQLEMSVPYNIVRSEQTQSVGFLETDTDNEWGSGFGNIDVGLAKTLWRETAWTPDLVGRVTWSADTGSNSDGDVALQTGGNAFTGSFSAVKRHDPIAFIGAAGYTYNTEADDFRPGDQWFVNVGGVLGITPTTSARAVLNQSFSQDFEINGDQVNGSDRNSTVLTLGTSSVIFPGGLLDVSLGIGLTDDAPDYSLMVSLPIRFDTPVFTN